MSYHVFAGTPGTQILGSPDDLTGLVSPLQLKLSDLFLFWNILILVHSILLWKQTDWRVGP